MGVPQMYRDISQKYPLIESITIALVGWLYFDMNGIIHWAKGKVANERTYDPKHHDAYEKAILICMRDRIKQIMDLVDPDTEVGFFVDGPAPRAKMKQQLQRRVKGPKEVKIKQKAYDKINKGLKRQGRSLEGMGIMRPETPYDGNAITPGTVFMSKVNEYLFEIAKDYPKLNVVISTSNEPGEGEHKMFNYIKRNCPRVDDTDPETMKKIVIVGLDADLILLSLVTHFKNIFLMRESNKIEQIGHENVFTYADIGLYRRFLLTTIRAMITEIDVESLYHEAEAEQIIDDYVFMCSLLGNDFIPHSPALSIGEDGISRLLKIYVKAFDETKQHLVKVENRHNPDKIKTTINVEPIRKILNTLAIEEDKTMTKMYDKRLKLERFFPRNRKDNPNVMDDEYHKIYFKPIQKHILSKELDLCMYYDPGAEDVRNRGHKAWRKIYYEKVLRMSRNVENINNISQNYLEGITWVFNYYYTESHSWGWYYRYLVAPTFKDLAIYMNKYHKGDDATFPMEDTKKARIVPYQPFQQLMMVLPKYSSHLLPTRLGKYMRGEIGDLGRHYSEDVELNYFFHRCLWQTEPIIDLIDEGKVELIVSKTPLTKEEQRRNSFDTTKVISPH